MVLELRFEAYIELAVCVAVALREDLWRGGSHDVNVWYQVYGLYAVMGFTVSRCMETNAYFSSTRYRGQALDDQSHIRQCMLIMQEVTSGFRSPSPLGIASSLSLAARRWIGCDACWWLRGAAVGCMWYALVVTWGGRVPIGCTGIS